VQALQGFRVDGDVVVLLGTAVILLADGGNRLGQLGHGGALYAHRADVLAQGLPQSAAEAGVALIDDEALLGLVARFPHTLSWK
jgi:sulfur relay protein TusB/DsrH